MKKLIAVLAIGLTMMSMSMTADAARRFGGGASFGRSAPTLQKSTPAPAAPTLQKGTPGQQQQQAAPNQQTRPNQPAAAPSLMRGMLMGLAGILGITALAHALGFGEGFANFLMMALMAFATFYVIRLLMGMFMAKKMATQAPASGMSGGTHQTMRQEQNTYRSQAAQSAQEPSYQVRPMSGSLLDELSGSGATKQVDIPADFDVAGFLKVAEENFVKMQKAWDTGNVTALSDFTTDDVFLTVTHQLRERGNQNYETVVISLKSEFRGIVQDGDDYLAGVTFTGTLNVSGEAEQINETWILSKPVKGNQGWLLSGIHQEQE